jgi:hypothetical protein
VESLENQRQVFHPSPRPLGISQKPRDSHIPTASTADSYSPCKRGTARRTGDPGKLEIQERDSHFPTVAKPPAAQGKKFKNQYERRVLPLYEAPHFQDHLVLESKVVFRIILRLENAAEGKVPVQSDLR